jgi:hypothetical protein
MINAIKYMDELEQSGFTQDQAKTSVNTWLELMNENFATKSDLKNDINELRTELKNDIKELGLSLRHEMKEMNTSIRSDMKLMEISLKAEIQKSSDTLTIKLGSIMAIGVSLMLAIQVFK